jgi:hypothetical protein
MLIFCILAAWFTYDKCRISKSSTICILLFISTCCSFDFAFGMLGFGQNAYQIILTECCCLWSVFSYAICLISLTPPWYPFSGPSSFHILEGHSKATMFLICNNAAQGILSSFFFKYAGTLQTLELPAYCLLCSLMHCISSISFKIYSSIYVALMGVSTTIFHKCKFLLKPECTLHKTRLAWVLSTGYSVLAHKSMHIHE